MDCFTLENRKKQRKQITNYLFTILDQCYIPNNMIAFVIKANHLCVTIMTLIIYLFAPLNITIFILVTAICSRLLFWYFHGCFISILEYKLNNTEFINIIDPFLCIFNMEIDNDNRRYMTLKILDIYFIVSILIIYTRFKLTNNPANPESG